MKLASARTPGTEDTMTTGPVQAGPTTAAGNAPETLSGRRAIAPEPWAADDEPETELPVPVGELLGGKYSVEATFAEGGMGIVCLGRHVQLDQPVAIKFLRRALAGRPAIAQRFLNEARALAALRSEHVVRVMDVGQLDSGRPYLVMEHLDGMHLEALLDRHGALDVETAIGYVLQVCEPLAEAHALGIVHRDLKPENLFLWSGGPAKDTIKVLDFGLAKQLGSAALGVTGPQDSLGSPGYMSPEQITTPQLVDARSDIWSLGVVLYRLLTNTLPFGGDSLVEVLSHILNATPPPLAQLRPYLATRAQMTQSAESQIVTAPQPSSSISKRAEKIRIPGVHSRWPALLAVLVVLLATAVVVGDRSGRIRLRNLSDGWLTPARLAADSPARTQKPAELPQLALSKQGANAVPELERAAGANPFPNRDAEPTSAVPLSDEERARKEEAYREYLASQGLTPLREVEVEPAPEPAPEPR
jgi:serine/threonine protein kinase